MFHITTAYGGLFRSSGAVKARSLRTLAGRVRRSLCGRDGASVGAFATFLPLAAMTIWMWSSTADETRQVAQSRFEFKTAEARFAIEQRLLAYEQVLRGGIAMFAATGGATRDEWRTYVAGLNLEKNYPGIQGMAYSQRIAPGELDAHIRKIRAEGYPDYTVRPVGARDSYLSILYIEPLDWRNQRAIGFDLMTEPTRREALVRARDTGLPSVSGKIKLLQETNREVQNGFLMCMPVYAPGASPVTAEERRLVLNGYICSVFRMRDLMQGIFGPGNLPDLRLEIFDGDHALQESSMYDSLAAAVPKQGVSAAFSADQVFDFNGRSWVLRFESLPAFDAGFEQQKTWLILVGGLLLSLLFSAVVWALATNRRRALELARVNTGLESEIEGRIKLEAELKAARDAAETANQVKGEFLANVSHELRTPLTLILAPIEQLLAAKHTPPGSREQLERVQRNALILLNRVNDTLDFSKAEAGKCEIHPEVVDVTVLLKSLAADALPVAAKKMCTISTQLDASLNNLYLDRGHFEKIALNFIGNALKFTPPGGHIEIETLALDGGWFEFAVRDSGPGIAAENLPLLFQRFQQIDNSATRRHGGTGIGLALVKGLTELMGGNVGVETEPGKGARFFVRLPCRLAEESATPAADATARNGEADIAALRCARFGDAGAHAVFEAPSYTQIDSDGLPWALVADDNADMRAYIAGLLANECRVLTAANGQEALALIERQPVDVVISDVMMPKLDGLGLAAAVKSHPHLAHIPIILVTARGGGDESAYGLDAGADDYVAKPFSRAEFLARVRAALRMAAAQRQLRERSREAGVAMVATGVVHNLGNILNGVSVSSVLIRDTLKRSRLSTLREVSKLLTEHAQDLPDFVANDERGRVLPKLIAKLNENLEGDHTEMLQEAKRLVACVEHAAQVIASEQSFAKSHLNVCEIVSAPAVMDEALMLSRAAFEMHGIDIHCEHDPKASLAADRHKILQILLNLLSNARHAVRDLQTPESKQVWLRTRCNGDEVVFEVRDNGIGIHPDNMAQLFNQGFSTKKEGHGFGLHSSANWARELGGALTCESAGPGLGACFLLSLPASPQGPADNATSTPQCALVT
jgi:signal transduction histidine kinase